MEYKISVCILKTLQAGNRIALFIVLRISVRCQDYAYGCIVLKFQFHLIQSAVNAGFKKICQIVFHPWEHHLGLRITEAGVVLQHLGAIFSEHQTKENDPLKFSALRSHGIHRRLIDLFPAECIYLGGIEGTWGKCAHSACI